jgi:hypothetical protein
MCDQTAVNEEERAPNEEVDHRDHVDLAVDGLFVLLPPPVSTLTLMGLILFVRCLLTIGEFPELEALLL